MQKIVISNVLGPCATNTYTIANPETREAVIVDPAARGDFLAKMYKDQRLKPVAIVLTHGHFDHIGALAALRESYPDIKVYAGAAEKELLANPRLNLSEMFGTTMSESADIYLEDGEEIELIGAKVRAIHVPGHTIGGTCYYFVDDGICFSGDTLFNESVGRSDFPTGDEHALLTSIKDKLFTLPESTVVYPGHNSKTDIRYEKNNNPYFWMN